MQKDIHQEIWSSFLTGRVLGKVIRNRRRLLSLLPGSQRCKNCNAPFDKTWSFLMTLVGHGRYPKNPRFCRF